MRAKAWLLGVLCAAGACQQRGREAAPCFDASSSYEAITRPGAAGCDCPRGSRSTCVVGPGMEKVAVVCEAGRYQVALEGPGPCPAANDSGTLTDGAGDACPAAVSMATEDRACTLPPGTQCPNVCRQCDGNQWIIDHGSRSPCTCNASGIWDCTHIPVDCLPATLGCTPGSFADPQCRTPYVCPAAD